MQLTYNPAIFNVSDISQAMRIILTPEDSTTEARWNTETPYLADLIGSSMTISPVSVLLDYGCGIGRIAKELITRYGCSVIGVDISPSMRELAVNYVQSDRFFTCSPIMLDTLIERGIAVDCALSVWVLQHCVAPAEDSERIRRALRPDGRLFILNGIYRAVPSVEMGWVNDGIDLRAMLRSEFEPIDEGQPSREKTTPGVSQATFWATYRRRT